MPRGYDQIPSATKMPDRLLKVVGQFLALMKERRRTGKTTPQKMIHAKEIMKKWNDAEAERAKARGEKPKKVIQSDADIRAMVSYWRERGEPIAGQNGGYFYALSPEELEATFHQLRDRVSRMNVALAGLEKYVNLHRNGSGVQPSMFDEN